MKTSKSLSSGDDRSGSSGPNHHLGGVGAWLGWTLDAKLGWSNVLQLLLPGLGFIASLTLVYRAFPTKLKNNMTNHRLILRDALLALPIVVGIGFWLEGVGLRREWLFLDSPRS